MSSDFPWRLGEDDETGAPFYWNVLSNERVEDVESIPLPAGWYYIADEDIYFNPELKTHSTTHPDQLTLNDSVKGLPYAGDATTDDKGNLVYKNCLTGGYEKEADIALPDGWKRGKTHSGLTYYHHTENKEYSFHIPGVSDKSVRSAEAVFHKLTAVSKEFNELKYHLQHREVVARCENVITHALIKLVGGRDLIEGYLPADEDSFPPNTRRLKLYHLLNLLWNVELRVPVDTDGLEKMATALKELKTIDHKIVHHQTVSHDELHRIMIDIMGKLQRSQDGDNQVALIDWIYDHHAEYLGKGNHTLLDQSSAQFPWQTFFPPPPGPITTDDPEQEYHT